MARKAPQPLEISWTCKPVESARSGIRILGDGRMQCWIEHEVIRGVTPAMLCWWFKHLEGDINYQGQRLSRYRVWHPRDHVGIRYARRGVDGTVGVGSVIHLTEMLGANPNHLVDVQTEITRLDEGGFAHRPWIHGMRLARMDYEFRNVHGGTLYRNSLTVGQEGMAARPLNWLIRRLLFDQVCGQAWIKHNIEEVGNFESFLPELYASKTATGARTATAA